MNPNLQADGRLYTDGAISLEKQRHGNEQFTLALMRMLVENWIFEIGK